MDKLMIQAVKHHKDQIDFVDHESAFHEFWEIDPNTGNPRRILQEDMVVSLKDGTTTTVQYLVKEITKPKPVKKQIHTINDSHTP